MLFWKFGGVFFAFVKFCVCLDIWLSNLKVTYKGYEIEVMSEGSDDCRLLDKVT